MARKPSSERERRAREQLKERFDAEMRACGGYFALLDRRDALAAEIAEVDVQLDAAVASIVDASTIERAADLVDWPKTRVRDAVRSVEGGAGGAGGDTAAVVA